MGGRKPSLAVISSTLLAVSIFLETCLHFTNAIEATISADQVILWGSTVTINCTLDQSIQNPSPSEILWYKDSVEEALPSGLSQAVDEFTSSLSLSAVTDEDSGTYYCALPSDGADIHAYQSSKLRVGKLPASPVNVECHSRDMLSFWCTWQCGGDSLLDTEYTFQYQGIYDSLSGWRNCPDYLTKGDMSCNIPALRNSGLEQTINITATNTLGSTWSVHRYNPNKSTIPHPPTNVRAEIVSPSEIQARWDLPMEWKDYMSTYLSYRLRILEGSSESQNDQRWREIPSRRLIQRGRFIQTSFHIIHNLQPGTHYHIQAACKYRYSRPRGECWSNWSSPVNVDLPVLAPSGTVDDLEFTEYHRIHDPQNPKRDIILTWEPVPFHLQNGEIQNYTIAVKSQDENSNTTLEIINLSADVTTYQIEDLNLHKEYGISISACNQAGCGPNATINLENLQEIVPLQPFRLRVLDLANQSLLFTWSTPEFGAQVNHFLMQWTDSLQSSVWNEVEIPGGERQFILNEPMNPGTYSFRVQAFNSLQQGSPWSRTLSVHLDGIQLTRV